MKRLFIIMMACTFTLNLFNATVLSLSQEQKDLFDIGVDYYDLEGQCGVSTGCGSQFKVASYNILGKSHDPDHPDLPDWDERIVKVKDNIIQENIDVIGFQEFQGAQRDYLDQNLEGYERSKHGKQEDSIMWNTNRFTKTDQGTWKTVYFGGPINEPWVRLRDNSSGQEFYFMSLHDPINNGQGSATTRHENAQKHVAKIQELQSQAPVIIVGDFNNGYRKSDGAGALSDDKTAYCVLSTAGMTHGLDSLNDRDYKCSGSPRPDSNNNVGSRIDHVFISEGVRATEYYGITKPQSGSDHSAVVANVTIEGDCGVDVPEWVGMPTNIQAPVGGTVNGNISAVAVNSKFPSAQREVLRKISQRDPDFIALNEVFRESIRGLESHAPRYGAWKDNSPDGTEGNPGQALNNAIMWKKDTWELLDKGRIKVVEDDKTIARHKQVIWDRFAVWGIFERKSDGAIVSFVSTHMPTNPKNKNPTGSGIGGQWGNPPLTREEMYGQGMDILIQLSKVLGKHGPVIIGGDMNTHGNEGDWAAIPKMEAAGFTYTSQNDVMHIFAPEGTEIIDNRRVSGLPLQGDHSNGAEYAKIRMNGVGPSGGGASTTTTGSGENCTCDNPDDSLVGGDNAEKIFNFFRSKGLSPMHSAAVTGNASVESAGTFHPEVFGGGGNRYRGIFQWGLVDQAPQKTGEAANGFQISNDTSPPTMRGGRWGGLVTWTGSQGLQPLTLEGQLNFAWHEGTTNADSYDIEELKAQPDIESASDHWGRYFERAITNGALQAQEERRTAARLALETFGDGAPGLGSPSNCGDSSGGTTDVIELAKKIQNGARGLQRMSDLKGDITGIDCGDCVAFVTTVYVGAGYPKPFNGTYDDEGSGIKRVPFHGTGARVGYVYDNTNYEIIPNSQKKPGDILVWGTSHTAIYAGDNKAYEGGGGSGSNSSNTCNIGGDSWYSVNTAQVLRYKGGGN